MDDLTSMDIAIVFAFGIAIGALGMVIYSGLVL